MANQRGRWVCKGPIEGLSPLAFTFVVALLLVGVSMVHGGVDHPGHGTHTGQPNHPGEAGLGAGKGVAALDAWSRKLYHSQVPDPNRIGGRAIEQFDRWLSDFHADRASASAQNAILLARERLVALKELLKQDPQAAWQQMLSDADRSDLPDEVAAYTEQEVSGVGDWYTYNICFSGLPFDEFHEAVLSPGTSNEKQYRAFPVGKLSNITSQRGITLHGFIVDDIAVFDGELFEPSDDSGPAMAGAPLESVTGLRDSLPLSGRQGGSDTGGKALDYRTMLYMRIAFADDPTEVVQSESNAYSEMRTVNNHILDASYGRMQVLATVTPIIVLPQDQSYYTTPSLLGTEARAAASALGYSPGQYGHRVYRYSGSPGTFGGLATVNANPGNIWMRNSNAGVLVHEMGHNYKLMHSGGWNTDDKAAIGPSDHAEYGHTFDPMGNAGGYVKGQFCSYQKDRLGWLKDSERIDVRESGRFRIHSLDDGRVDPDKHYSLKIPTEDRGNYWVEYRNNYTTNAFKNGTLLQAQGGGDWSGNNTKPIRIDVTYWSSKGKDDSNIPLGWTFSDHEQGLHITPVARDGDLNWIDMQVNKGSFPGNQPPVAILTADTTSVATGVKVNLSVTATDPDGDELAYHWYYDDNNWHGNRNKTSVSKSWSNAGVRTVICTVSDMKGGVSIKKMLITVGSPTTFTISGRAKDHSGNPVAGAPVDNDLSKTNSNYRSTITDDDGNYTMTRLPASNYTIKCRKDYDVYNNNFSNPVTVGPDTTGIDFTARVLKVSAVGTSLSEAGGTADFLIERVGSNTTLLKLNFRVLGKAAQNTDYTITPDPNGGIYRLEKEWDSLRLTVTGIDDGDVEGPEDVVFTLAMTNNLSVIGPNTIARLTIEDDDTALPRVRLAAVDEFMPENGGTALARVTRYGSLALPLTVYFDTANAAEYGVDYTFSSGVQELTIPAGESTADLEVVALDDALIEGKESLKITFQNGDYIKDSDQKNAIINITDDDIPTVTIDAVDETSSEPGVNDGAVRFARTGDATDELSINYGVRGTALHGTDYAQLSGVATIPAGSSYVDVAIGPLTDAIDDDGETAKLRMACDNSDYVLGEDIDTTVNIYDGRSPDVNGDGKINIADFSFIAAHWLDACTVSDWCQGADFDASESIGPDDAEILFGSWLGL